MIKLNIGCNDIIFDGWINSDLYEHKGAVLHDARNPFPYADNEVDFIFSEHFIEHLNETEALVFFKECYRLLKPSGVIRTATFSIDEIIRGCATDESWKEYSKTLLGGRYAHHPRIRFFNFAVYEGAAHKYMWNNDELIRFLKEVGFINFNTPKRRHSAISSELINLEWRENSNCIVEAIK